MKKLIILAVVAALVLTGCTAVKTDEDMMDKASAGDQTIEDTTMAEGNEEKDSSMESEEMADNLLDTVLYDIDGNEWNLAELEQKAVVKVWAS